MVGRVPRKRVPLVVKVCVTGDLGDRLSAPDAEAFRGLQVGLASIRPNRFRVSVEDTTT